MSDGQNAYVGGNKQDNDIQATGDDDGTTLFGNDGNDTLRGGSSSDILNGGSDNDELFGGDDADQFRFFAADITGGQDTDNVRDLDFGEGDLLVFGGFGSGTFTDSDGVDAFNGGSDVRLSSWEGVVNAVDGSANVTAFKQFPASTTNDNLVLRVTDSDGDIMDVVITGGWSAYVAAGGTEGVPSA